MMKLNFRSCSRIFSIIILCMKWNLFKIEEKPAPSDGE